MFRRWFLMVCLGLMSVLALQPGVSQAQPFTVAILVVDDFNGIELSEIEPPPEQTAVAVNLEGQAFISRGASAQAVAVPHGELVYALIEDMLTELGAVDMIEVVKVDVQGQTTAETADILEQALSDTPADVYVVNMSFAIIPSEFLQPLADFEQQLKSAGGSPGNFKSLFQRAVIFYDGQVFPVNSKKFQDATDLDPLQEFFVAHADNVIPVAAAGNFGLDYPFWPAAWGQVISASASTGEGSTPPASWDKKNNSPLLGADTEEKGKKGTRISNYGEIMLPGEYTSEDSGVVIGTSFAAPRLSVLMALYAAQTGTAYCRKDDNSPALAYGEWDNLTLDEAVAEYCPDMQPYLP